MSSVIDPTTGQPVRWLTWLRLLTQWANDYAILAALHPSEDVLVMLRDILWRLWQGTGDNAMDERDMASYIVAFTDRREVRHAIVRATQNKTSIRARVRALAEIRAEALTLVGD